MNTDTEASADARLDKAWNDYASAMVAAGKAYDAHTTEVTASTEFTAAVTSARAIYAAACAAAKAGLQP